MVIYAFNRDYIPSMVKIGSSKNWQKRLADFNKLETNCGERWHCMAIVDAEINLEDYKFHTWMAKNHPEIKKIREFYKMTPKLVCKCIGEYISECGSVPRTMIMNPGEENCYDKTTFEFIPPRSEFIVPDKALPDFDPIRSKKTLFERGLKVGSVLNLVGKPNVKCVVSGPTSVKYNGKIFPTLSNLTCHILKKPVGTASGPQHWRHNGTLLSDIL